jgi:hypothetical protein
LFAAMTRKISLSVAFEVKPPGGAAPLNWVFPNARMHDLAAPLNVLRQTDVDSEQSRHGIFSLEQICLADFVESSPGQ